MYHGSIHLFDTIDVSKGLGFKDFGSGFYTSGNRGHSVSLVKRNKKLEEDRYRRVQRIIPRVHAYLYSFELNLDVLLHSSIRFKDFKQADGEWLLFVASNRNSSSKIHDFDIVRGPTANDSTSSTLIAYRRGLYGDPLSAEAINTALRLLEPNVLPVQWYFGSAEASKYLLLKGREELYGF